MPNNTIPDNFSAYQDSQVAQDWFRPTTSFFDGSSPCLSLVLQPAGSDKDPAQPQPRAHEASTIGMFSAPASLPLASSSAPPAFNLVQPPAFNLPQDQIHHLLEMGTSEAFCLLFQHGHLQSLVISGYHALECPHCGQTIKTSIPSTIVLENSGHFNALTSHYRHKPCLIAFSRNEQDAAYGLVKEICLPAGSRRSLSLTLSSSSLDTEPGSACHSISEPEMPPTLQLESDSSFRLLSRCFGLPFHWTCAPSTNMQMNIPWSRTLPGGTDELSFTLNVIDGQLFAQSPECTRVPQPKTLYCPACAGLEAKVRDLGQTIVSYRSRTRRSLLTITQLHQLIDERNLELNRWKFKSLNDTRRIGYALETLDTHSALVMALSRSDVPWLRHLLFTLHKNGAGIRAILRHIEDAIINGYKPHSYNQDELDLSLLIYRVGGGNLLSALSQRLCLPAMRTLRHRTSTVKLAPTIGPITSATIARNIHSVVVEPRTNAGCSTLRGVSLMTDETALEEVATYHPAENGVGGCCWKHAGNIYPYLDNYESASQLAAKIASGEVHLGKEMTVVVAHCFGEDGTYPLLAAPSCKEEDHLDWEDLILKLVDTWYETDAHKSVGPLWSFATDGDATRRKAGHKIFMGTKLTASSPLYGVLSPLTGLNIHVGPREMTMDFDYKHLLKRVCTALRSSHGIRLNNGRLLTSKTFLRYLPWMDDMDEDHATKLLFPDDPQDVPRAVELIRAIVRLADIDPTRPPYTMPQAGLFPDVDTVIDFEAIRMLAQILHHLLEPFVDPSLSLSRQVSCISTCSHLLFCQYRLNRTAFIPNQLYYDMMTAMKNIIFSVAKQLWLDPSSTFSLLDVGTDPIEVLFALIRMCGGHNSAINYKQGIDRLRSACDISGIYARNPDLHHGHRRLNLTRSEHVDHINRDMWQGDTIVRNCNLQTAWFDGRAIALSILSTSPLNPRDYDFDRIFSDESIDMLCVFGGGRYPSINQEDDGEDTSTLLRPDLPVALPGPQAADPLGPVEDSRDDEQNGTDDDNEPMLSFEDQLENDIETGLVAVDTDFTIPLQTEITIPSQDEVLDPSQPLPPTGKGIRPLDYLLYKGKWVHKASVCRLLLNNAFTPKSHDRLLRVRGFTPVNKLSKTCYSSSPFLTEPSFIVGNPFLTLIRLNDHSTSIALVHSTNIYENGIPRNDIHVKALQANSSKIKVSGNILLLVPSDSPKSDSQPDSMWIWTGGYLTVASSVPGLNITTQKVVEISVVGPLIELVNPCVVMASAHLAAEKTKQINSHDITWSLDNEALKAAIDLIWKRVLEMKLPVSNITLLRTDMGLSEHFPYCSKDGLPALLCEAASSQLSTSNLVPTAVICPRCNKPTTDSRSHMGAHILRLIRGVEDTLVSPVDHLFPCGFCGRSQLTHPDCTIKIKVTARGVEVDTHCPYQVLIRFTYAERGSKKRPCRNIPLICPLCPLPPRARETDWREAVWRYNMEQHLNFTHEEYSHPGKLIGLPLPSEAAAAILVDSREEEAFGVPVRPAFTNIVTKDIGALSAREKRRLTDASAFAAGAASGGKRARTKN